MDYVHCLQELYALTPRGMTLGLERIAEAALRLGAPHLEITAVQIAGTNGKGSVSCVLARTAQLAGLSVGLYTSPHLHRFAERIRINGLEATPEELTPCLQSALAVTRGEGSIPLSFFEVTTLAALLLFAKRKLDLVVLEVGLGGRLDATSIVPPITTVITSIGLDHTQILGATEESIAREKAAISRTGVPMITGTLPPGVLSAVEEVCASVGAPLRVLGRDFHRDDAIRPPWPGAHQRRNARVVLEVCRSLRNRFPSMTDAVFHEGLATAVWPGRFEFIPGTPGFLLDGAHNMPAIIALKDALAERRVSVDTLIFGALQDKPFDQMIAQLAPLARRTILVNAPISRTFDAAAVARRLNTEHARDMDDALMMIRRDSPATGVILVTGSFFTVATARQILLDERHDPPVGL